MNCLIILGGGLTQEDTLPVHARLRYEKALKIHKKYDYILLSSGNTYRKEGLHHKRTEAAVGKEYLIKHDVAKNKILTETKSKDTFSNAYYCRLILDKIKITTFSVVTSRFHMPRSKFLFQLVFPKESKIKFIKSKNGNISKTALKNRKIHEKLVLKFFKKHLTTTYKVKQGNMKSIKEFLNNNNLATTGKMDKYQKELTKQINKKVDKRSPLLY